MNRLSDFRTQRVNANKHTERGIKALDNSITKDGWIGAVTVAADGETFDGSARLEALADAMPSAEPIVIETDGTRPVVVKRTDIPDTDDPRAKRLGVAANVIAHMDYAPDGEILAMIAADDDAVARLIKQDELSADAVAAALADGLLGDADAEPQIDRAAELNEKWQVQRGDLWRIGEHRLLCGDSTKREDVERVMQGERARMVFTDPPYNVSYQDNESIESLKARNRRTDGLVVSNDAMTDSQFDDFLKSFMSCFPLVEGGGFYLCAPPGRPETQFRNAIDCVSGLSLRECIVWVKDVFVFGRQDYHWRHESILYGWKDGAAHYFVDDHTQDTVWEFKRPRQSKEHPTMKPVELPTKAIANSSKHNDVVYEPFAGSGTTLVACQNLQRKCRAIEISPNYCAVTLERMATAFPGIEIKRVSNGTA